MHFGLSAVIRKIIWHSPQHKKGCVPGFRLTAIDLFFHSVSLPLCRNCNTTSVGLYWSINLVCGFLDSEIIRGDGP